MKGLRQILATNVPALELCLKFLLGKYPLPSTASGSVGFVPLPGLGYGADSAAEPIVGEDDDDDELPPGIVETENLPTALLIDHHTLPRGRHTQGLFGPNGTLDTF